jgi:peptide/nickel transport system substrate-binding protein
MSMRSSSGEGKRSARFSSILVAAALLAAACTGDGGEADSAGTAGGGPSGSVRFLIAENFWADWEPYQSTAQSQARLEEQIYDYLVQFPTGDLSAPEPMLATSWEQIDDTTWEFELRDGVKFHEGQDFTSADVKGSIELASGATKTETVTSQNWVPTTVEAVDDQTVRLVTEKPFAPLLAQLGDTPIVSAEWLNGDENQLKEVPNGTGPFKLASDTRTKKVMEANLDYWRDPPQIKELTWEFVQDPQTRLNALVSGQADAIDRVPPEHMATIEGNPDLALSSATGIESVNLWVRPGRLPIWDENEHFRKAVNWSIDRQALVDELVQGESTVATSYLPTETRFQVPQEPQYGFDPDMVEQELEAAGEPEGGPQFELWVATGFLPRAEQVVSSIADSMQQAGLKPKIVTSDVAGMIDDIFSESGSGAMYHLSWSSNGDPHQAAQVYAPPFAWFFGDKELERLVQEGLTTLDEAQREQIYGELQTHMWEQAWHVPLYNSDFSIGHSSSLVDLRVQPDFTTDFYPAHIEE